EDVDQFVGLAETTAKTLSSPWGGVEMSLAGMLQAPSFLYRLDATEDDPGAPGRKRFTDFSMASRLSYLLWGSAPDDELLDAAGSGSLSTEEGVRNAAQRLLGSTTAQGGVARFFDE